MSEQDIKEIKEILLALDKKVDGLDKKIETGLTEVRGEIKRLDEKIDSRFSQLDQKIDLRFAQLEEKMNGLDKRLGNEEVISRTAFATILAGALAGLIKYLFFSNNP
ncbi:hypothetical protein [Gloeothece verrucosa]|uniref:Putative Bdr protein n=1 Tax=Gloeothece verrucosa (strain PCC 7822) TaxID=497965 RepID=E0UHX7_GLOV7|nr:hypothetical protein [Gloeothece verrucosa]ADN14507.1 putative Bdr protein [Gloeothece verrucosa PCC 7822]